MTSVTTPEFVGPKTAPVAEFLTWMATLPVTSVKLDLPAVPMTAEMQAMPCGWDPTLLELAVFDAAEDCVVSVGWMKLG